MSLEGPDSPFTPSLSCQPQLQLHLAPVDWGSGCKSLKEPVLLPAVGHGPQRGDFCGCTPSKDDPVVQAVGLALPELYHLWVQDVATPTRRSRGSDALHFSSQVNPHPIPGPLKEVAGMHLMRVARKE